MRQAVIYIRSGLSINGDNAPRNSAHDSTVTFLPARRHRRTVHRVHVCCMDRSVPLGSERTLYHTRCSQVSLPVPRGDMS